MKSRRESRFAWWSRTGKEDQDTGMVWKEEGFMEKCCNTKDFKAIGGSGIKKNDWLHMKCSNLYLKHYFSPHGTRVPDSPCVLVSIFAQTIVCSRDQNIPSFGWKDLLSWSYSY